MTNIPNILLAFPTSDKKDYCLNYFLKQLSEFTYPNLDIIMIDNSINERKEWLFKQFEKYGLQKRIKYYYYNPKNLTFREMIRDCHNLIREQVLQNGYDFLYSLESDHFTAPNIIEHLLAFKKLVVGLPYFIGTGFASMYICSKTEMCGNIALEIALTSDLGFLYTDGFLKRTYQIGLGNTLIHRSVLEKIEFRIETEGKYNLETYFDDQFFYRDCKKLGIPVYVDTSNMSYHWNVHWDKILNKK